MHRFFKNLLDSLSSLVSAISSPLLLNLGPKRELAIKTCPPPPANNNNNDCASTKKKNFPQKKFHYGWWTVISDGRNIVECICLSIYLSIYPFSFLTLYLTIYPLTFSLFHCQSFYPFINIYPISVYLFIFPSFLRVTWYWVPGVPSLRWRPRDLRVGSLARLLPTQTWLQQCHWLHHQVGDSWNYLWITTAVDQCLLGIRLFHINSYYSYFKKYIEWHKQIIKKWRCATMLQMWRNGHMVWVCNWGRRKRSY